MRAQNKTSIVPRYISIWDLARKVSKFKKYGNYQPRYIFDWSADSVDSFLADAQKENTQFMKVGTIESEEVQYYTYMFIPNNSLILINRDE